MILISLLLEEICLLTLYRVQALLISIQTTKFLILTLASSTYSFGALVPSE